MRLRRVRPSSEPLVPLGWRSLLVFAASFAYLYWLQFQSPRIPGFDGYYHIKYAELLPSLGIVRKFKWAAQSVWAEHFADKELLYHLFLVPFARFRDPAVGLKYATVLLGAGAATSFYLVLGLERLRFASLWTILLFGSGGLFLYRLGSPRPHVLSILLLLWCIHLILERRRWALANVVFVYTLSYTAFHLALAMALIASVETFLSERRIEWRVPLTVAGAMAAGVLVNPYFPNNLRLFWLQNVAVPWRALWGGIPLHIAGELRPMGTRELLVSHLALAIPYAAAVFLAIFRPRRLDARTRSLFLMSAGFLVMTFVILRFDEYAVPVTLWFLAAFYTAHTADLDLRGALAAPGRHRARALAGLAIVALGTTGVVIQTGRDALPRFRPGPSLRRDAALYLREHTEPDELVFTCDWDDAPELFYYDDRDRYPVMLDPNFMVQWNPERYREWFSVARGALAARTYDVLARDYRFGVCTWDFEDLKRIVEIDPRMEVVYDDGRAWVFRIDREHPEISLDRFLELGKAIQDDR
jgi:hypothetical protein